MLPIVATFVVALREQGPSAHFQQNPFGFNVKPTDSTGMTRKSSGRRTCVAPKPRHGTMSSFGSNVLTFAKSGIQVSRAELPKSGSRNHRLIDRHFLGRDCFTVLQHGAAIPSVAHGEDLIASRHGGRGAGSTAVGATRGEQD